MKAQVSVLSASAFLDSDARQSPSSLRSTLTALPSLQRRVTSTRCQKRQTKYGAASEAAPYHMAAI